MRTKVERETSELPVLALPPQAEAERARRDEVRWARSQARRAAWRVLAPFLLAVLLGIGHLLFGAYDASRDLRDLAVKTLPAAAGPIEPVSQLAHRLAVEVYGDSHDEAAALRYESLVRVVAKELDRISGPDNASRLKSFERETRQLLMSHAAFPAGAQALLVIFFPALCLSSFLRAAEGIEQAAASGRPTTFAGHVWYRRYLQLLTEQNHLFFWRRLGFALLLGYGTMYLVAPVGVKAMAIGEYLVRNAIPGEPTYPFILSAFQNAPVFSVGFAGFYLYALTLFVRRYTTHDLNDRIFVPLFLRGISVALLGWVLASIGEESGLSRALVFAVGIFPQAGFQAIAKLTQTTVDRLSNEGSSAFKTIPEIDFWKETTLQELGINDFNDLAKANLDQLLVDLGMNPGVLVRAVDRAVLVHVLGADAAHRLAAIPLFSASDVVLYTRGRSAWTDRWAAVGIAPAFPQGDELTAEEKSARKAAVEKALDADDLCIQLDHLVHDRNVQTVIDNLLSYQSL